MDEKEQAAAGVLSMVVQPETVKKFFCLFVEGVTLPITTGGTLKATVCGQLGISEAYFEDRIQTIFLNFKAVDAPEEARVDDGAIVTLSAAMPGLVGATMRRGGHYAAMRSSISLTETAGDIESDKGFITLKLFNMVARELGPAFLARGVYLEGEQVAALLTGADPDVGKGCREAVLDGAVVTWEQLVLRNWAGRKVFLKVRQS